MLLLLSFLANYSKTADAYERARLSSAETKEGCCCCFWLLAFLGSPLSGPANCGTSTSGNSEFLILNFDFSFLIWKSYFGEAALRPLLFFGEKTVSSGI